MQLQQPDVTAHASQQGKGKKADIALPGENPTSEL